MDKDHLGRPSFLLSAPVFSGRSRPYLFLLPEQPAHALPFAQGVHDTAVLPLFPELPQSLRRTFHKPASYILLLDLSVRKPEVQFPDEADPYHQYDPSISGQ